MKKVPKFGDHMRRAGSQTVALIAAERNARRTQRPGRQNFSGASQYLHKYRLLQFLKLM